MTARDNFDIEKEARELALKNYLSLELMCDIADFGRRCQDAAYEKAAGLAAVYETIETGAISDKILALKTPLALIEKKESQ